MKELVFLQWGTFYEVLWDDADVAHRELGIAYTNRKGMRYVAVAVLVIRLRFILLLLLLVCCRPVFLWLDVRIT
jgi:hypothetical protein